MATTSAAVAITAPDRKRIIVDSQVHIWRANSPERPWSRNDPSLPWPFSYEELLQRMGEAGVDRAILVPPSFEGDRNDYVIEASQKHPDRFAAMGKIALDRPNPALVAKWREQPGMLGIRIALPDDKMGWLSDGTADWFWRAAVENGLPVMAQTRTLASVYHNILRRFPGLVILIDHMGLTLELVRAGLMQRCVEDTLSFARYPNVSVKLSALPAKSALPYPFPDLVPHIQRVFEAFGPKRCYWGSDLTVGLTKFNFTYRQRVTHFTETLPFLAESDKDCVMGRAILERLAWPAHGAQST